MAGINQSTWFQVVMAMVFTMAVIALIGFARGDDSDRGRSPEVNIVVVNDGD